MNARLAPFTATSHHPQTLGTGRKRSNTTPNSSRMLRMKPGLATFAGDVWKVRFIVISFLEVSASPMSGDRAGHAPALDRVSSKTVLLCHHRERGMAEAEAKTVEALIVALPESAGSAIYGLVDVFASTGTLWREFVGDEPGRLLIRPRIVSLSRNPFQCGN